MTGEAQTTLTSTAQIVFKHGAGAWGMARYTIHGGTGARVEGIVSDGMGESAVFPMAGVARLGRAFA